MRDQQWVAEHRGGPLTKEQHIQLIKWSCKCAEHVLSLLGKKTDERLLHPLYALKAVKNAGKSIDIERKWQNKQLPPEIRELVLSARLVKEKAFKIY